MGAAHASVPTVPQCLLTAFPLWKHRPPSCGEGQPATWEVPSPGLWATEPRGQCAYSSTPGPPAAPSDHREQKEELFVAGSAQSSGKQGASVLADFVVEREVDSRKS